ncbi:MAG: aminotransferase class I/II-fold pyridoxal phosphate-dependent enzyme [Bacteroidaceae bacterium]|nr:aminotransferase class I/II-fold pyridoxal phosphate-dependent enzyme [Bacteroidaceae bacterium]
MIHLESDYNNGAHETVLRHLLETNDERTQSYGDDRFSERARQLLRTLCEAPEAQVYFLAGGTQTNATILDCTLAPYEGVLCCETAHINVHEAGAVEFTGHKVIPVPRHSPAPQDDGKLHADDLRRWLEAYFADDTAEHMVRPGAVYVTLPTELGTLYTADELTALHTLCQQYGLRLYVDGARLAYGLAASKDVTLPFLARTADIFYVGGTKCGALCGEAVVFAKGDAPSHMLSRIKRHGALLAKSRVVGVQFEALLPLYLSIGREAVRLAMRLRRLFVECLGYSPFIDSPTNQQFYIIPNRDLERLRQHVGFEVWCPVDAERTACRFVTSWATTEAEIEELEEKMG